MRPTWPWPQQRPQPMLLRYLSRRTTNSNHHLFRRTIFNATSKRRVKKSIVLRSSVDQVASVVADVGLYSEFLPFCTRSVVSAPVPSSSSTSSSSTPPTTCFHADLTFEWGTFRETIRHRVEVRKRNDCCLNVWLLLFCDSSFFLSFSLFHSFNN